MAKMKSGQTNRKPLALPSTKPTATIDQIDSFKPTNRLCRGGAKEEESSWPTPVDSSNSMPEPIELS